MFWTDSCLVGNIKNAVPELMEVFLVDIGRNCLRELIRIGVCTVYEDVLM